MKKQITFLFVIAASIFSGPLSAQTVPTDNRSSIMALGNIDRNFWGLDGSIFKIDPANNSSTGGDAFILEGVGSSASALGNLDFNFWNSSVDPHNGDGGFSLSQNWIASSSVVNATNITYTLAATSNTLGGATSFSGISCGASYQARAKKDKSPKPQSIEFDSSDSPCQMMAYNISQYSEQGQWTMAYDSTQYFVAHCYTNSFATNAIGSANTDVQNGALGASPGCWEQNLQWLLSLLPMRTDAQWFCTIVQAVSGSLGDSPDSSWSQVNTSTNKGMSVLYWILHNPICTNSVDSELYVNGRGSQIRTWLDTQDTSKVPLDTTIYSMHDLGLDSVLKYAGLLGVNNNTPSIISSASAYPNPAGTGTVISFGVAREAYVGINLYDVLGHEVSSAGFGAVVEPGNLSVPMSLVGLPPGTYFARIQTTYGEAQTVKLVKE